MRGKLLEALSVYVARGQEALAVDLDAGGQAIETLLAILARRDAAYHNFVALDHHAVLQGFDIANDCDGAQLAHQAAEINTALEQTLREVSAAQKAALARLSGARRSLAGYLSGDTTPARLIKLA